ncbi:hypothetical protein RhiirA5_380965 [Rhizophagus irregularis]|uniref:Uncharacterized protein n=1 Tax=Rhizophagus irregularis TaxID=588596 RepID=A0A2N0P6K9_9GLOM|nr:hypothetical protein RhiirA5_380965 [Rhizophagus irregularis]
MVVSRLEMEKESSGEKSLAKLITGDHVIEKFQGLVRSYRLLDLYAKGKPKWRVMKNEAKYFQEFSLHFWKKPEYLGQACSLAFIVLWLLNSRVSEGYKYS